MKILAFVAEILQSIRREHFVPMWDRMCDTHTHITSYREGRGPPKTHCIYYTGFEHFGHLCPSEHIGLNFD